MRPLTKSIIRDLVEGAKVNPRDRLHRNLHGSYEEPCQRLFNAVGIGSYIRPHRHTSLQREETLLAVRGLFALFVFDDAGFISSVSRFGSEFFDAQSCSVGVELAPGEWHTVVALVPGSVLFEVKTGPFDPNAAKEFAPWSPVEGSRDAADYLAYLRARAE